MTRSRTALLRAVQAAVFLLALPVAAFAAGNSPLPANSAAALIESGNLLLMGNRLLDKGDWVKLTRDFMKASQMALDAANKKSKDDILTAGGELNATCDNCHEKYQR